MLGLETYSGHATHASLVYNSFELLSSLQEGGRLAYEYCGWTFITQCSMLFIPEAWVWDPRMQAICKKCKACNDFEYCLLPKLLVGNT